MQKLFNYLAHLFRRAKASFIDFDKIENISFENVDYKDAPDFCDAYISYAEINGRELTEEEYDYINSFPDWVYAQLITYIY